MDGDTCAVEIASLTKSFGKFTAVNDLNMKIGKGEFMGLLGPNGAGKSTTLKCLTGLIRPTSGQILIDGIDVQKHHREALAHTGCVIETPEFYPSFTPADAMLYAGKVYGLNKEEIRVRAKDVLEEMRMWEWRYKNIGQFSKGMRQRVALAQALLPNPSLVILDEPTSGLDPRGMIEMREVMNSLKNGERSMLISTHILKEVSEMCDYVTMINHGKTIISGEVASLIHNSEMNSKGHVDIELRTFRSMTPAFMDDLRGSVGVTGLERMGDKLIKVEFNGSEEDEACLVDVVYKHDLRLLGMSEKGADLESLYMDLTRNDEVNIK